MECKGLKIGETGVLKGIKYVCIKEEDNTVCDNCAFDDLKSCYDADVHACLGECGGEDREDGTNVIFKKVVDKQV